MNNLPPPQPDIDLRHVIAVLRRQIRIIVYSFIAVFSLAAIFLFTATPRYSATALLLVDPHAKGIMDNGPAQSTSTGSENARVDSEAEILRSDAVALPVVTTRDLTVDPEFAPSASLGKRIARIVGVARASAVSNDLLTAKTLARFKDSVSVSRRGLTYVLGVSVTSESAPKAAALANAVAQTYLQQQIQSKISGSLGARDLLVAQANQAREQLRGQQATYDEFLDQNLDKIVERNPSAPLLDMRRDLLNKQDMLEQNDFRAQEIQFLVDQGDWGQAISLLGDKQLAGLNSQRQTLLAESGGAQTDLASALSKLDGEIEKRVQQGLAELDAETRLLEQSAISLRGDIRDQLLDADIPSDILTELYAIRQESNIAQSQYSNIVSRIQELETQSRLQVADSRIVSPALVPIAPDFPNTALVLLVALAASMGLGVSAAFLKEYYVGGVTTETQLVDMMQVPSVAAIPVVNAAGRGDSIIPDEIVDNPLSAYSESLRKLRATIDQTLGGLHNDMDVGVRNGKIILVTSAVAGEGKSTTALSLARTYAAAGQKTLLVDGDLRRPALHRMLGFAPPVGFVDYLRAPDTVEQSKSFYARDPAGELAVILGAGRSEMATDQMLTSKTFGSFLLQAREVYDVTIIDSPPLLPVVDARYIAPQVDAVVMAVKWAATNQGDLRSAVGPLKTAMKEGAPLIPVMTQVGRGFGGMGYDGHYGSYSAAI